jgi:nitrile hydratase
LLEKGVITEKDIQCQIEYQEARTPANGAKLVARAWTDPAFKARFIADPKGACAEMGIDATAINEFVVLENSKKVRHMVVCTLCSCYPRPILGRPPDWYKSFNYRQRSVADPRGVMRNSAWRCLTTEVRVMTARLISAILFSLEAEGYGRIERVRARQARDP